MCSTCKNQPLKTKEQNLEFKQVKRGMKYSFILQTDVPGSETVEKTVSIRKYLKIGYFMFVTGLDK